MKTTTHRQTRAVRAGIDSDSQFGAVVPPVYLSSTFSFADFDCPRRHDYTRSGNPTRDTLAEALAELEGGAGGVVTASGMAAILTVVSLLQPDDLLLAPHDCYGGSWRLFSALAGKGCFRLQWNDFSAPDAGRQVAALQPAMVWLETPSNPLLRITDIRAVAASARAAGARVVVDNTFLSPVRQLPLSLGADIVVHSTTKYLNGHSDVVGGAVICRTVECAEQLAWWANCLGVTGAPFDSFLTLRGLRSLAPRMRTHEENARNLVERLQSHRQVRQVYYPGLSTHPGHVTAKRQQQGFGAMISFELHGGEAAVRAFLDGLQCFSLAESLGGVESLIAHPATMTHAAMSPEARQAAGISDSLLRLSVGIEHSQDLVDDIQAGLQRAAALSLREKQL